MKAPETESHPSTTADDITPAWAKEDIYKSLHSEKSLKEQLGIDPNNLIEDQQELAHVVRMLSKQETIRITRDQTEALRNAKLTTFDMAFTNWNSALAQEYAQQLDEESREFTELKRDSLLAKAERGRSRCVNLLIAILFHLLVVTNFVFCLWESYGIIVESAKFEHMLLQDLYQCLRIPSTQHALFHFVKIFHAMTCVVVLYARTRKTANLCWTFLVGGTLHACHMFYEVLYFSRFEYDERIRETPFHVEYRLIFLFVLQVLGKIIVLLRYYDLTEQFEARAHEFAVQTYEGRQLNDKIIYRNVSSFLQRKFVMRSCTSLQIFITVEKLQTMKKKLKKGETISEEEVTREVEAAVAGLKEVEHIRGMEMLRELKRRHYEKREQQQMEADRSPGGGSETAVIIDNPPHANDTDNPTDEPIVEIFERDVAGRRSKKDDDRKAGRGSKKYDDDRKAGRGSKKYDDDRKAGRGSKKYDNDKKPDRGSKMYDEDKKSGPEASKDGEKTPGSGTKLANKLKRMFGSKKEETMPEAESTPLEGEQSAPGAKTKKGGKKKRSLGPTPKDKKKKHRKKKSASDQKQEDEKTQSVPEPLID